VPALAEPLRPLVLQRQACRPAEEAHLERAYLTRHRHAEQSQETTSSFSPTQLESFPSAVILLCTPPCRLLCLPAPCSPHAGAVQAAAALTSASTEKTSPREHRAHPPARAWFRRSAAASPPARARSRVRITRPLTFRAGVRTRAALLLAAPEPVALPNVPSERTFGGDGSANVSLPNAHRGGAAHRCDRGAGAGVGAA
jgi:hypothetical protein